MRRKSVTLNKEDRLYMDNRLEKEVNDEGGCVGRVGDHR